MDTRTLVDPELQPMLDLMPAMDLQEATLDQHRLAMDAMTSGETPAGVRIARHETEGLNGAPNVSILVHTPATPKDNRPAFLHVHGGGYVMGSAQGFSANCAALALRHDCVVASVDYRLAPETPFPGPLDDCYAALCWFHDAASSLGANPQCVAIGGESAGGGLAAALALAARERGGPPIRAQMLTYPMLDHRTGSPSSPFSNRFAGQFGWTPALNQFGWRAMTGGAEPVSHLCSPAVADNLEGLPPTFIAVGTLDLFLDENIDYAQRLIRQGVPTEVHVYPGAFHGFDMVEDAKVTQRFRRDYHDALARAFSPG